MEDVYVAALEGLAVGDYDSTALRAYNRHFAALAEQAAGEGAGLADNVSCFGARRREADETWMICHLDACG